MYKIEPEAVTNELYAKSIKLLGHKAFGPGDLVEFLGECIEAGLVSPPCYTVRDNQGNLLDDEVYGLWATPDAAESQHKEDYTAEHWKGLRE